LQKARLKDTNFNTAYKFLSVVEILPMKKVPKCHESKTYYKKAEK
jgi:hypothetical protein